VRLDGLLPAISIAIERGGKAVPAPIRRAVLNRGGDTETWGLELVGNFLAWYFPWAVMRARCPLAKLNCPPVSLAAPIQRLAGPGIITCRAGPCPLHSMSGRDIAACIPFIYRHWISRFPKMLPCALLQTRGKQNRSLSRRPVLSSSAKKPILRSRSKSPPETHPYTHQCTYTYVHPCM
jgi:hypothetical protein